MNFKTISYEPKSEKRGRFGGEKGPSRVKEWAVKREGRGGLRGGIGRSLEGCT